MNGCTWTTHIWHWSCSVRILCREENNVIKSCHQWQKRKREREKERKGHRTTELKRQRTQGERLLNLHTHVFFWRRLLLWGDYYLRSICVLLEKKKKSVAEMLKNVCLGMKKYSNSSENDNRTPLWNVKERMLSLTFASAVGRGIIITNHLPLEAFKDTDTRRHSSFWTDSSSW